MVISISSQTGIKRCAAPLLKLSGNGGQIAFQHRQRLGDRHLKRLNGAEFASGEAHQMHGFGLARFVKTERNGRAAVADMLAAADDLRPVNMPEGNVVGGGKFCAGNASSVPI